MAWSAQQYVAFEEERTRPVRDLLAAVARYEEAVAAAYPALPDGTVLLPFPRLFIIATAAR